MSTLAACRADNFYHPPDYDPKNRKKEIEKKKKEGKLKVRKQGSRVIRFEMPFHVRCANCNSMIAKGVRFNAEKKKAGRYLGTIIYQFSMPCTICKNSMTIKTDPEKCQYLLVSGVTKYCDEYKHEQDEVIKIQTPEEGEQLNKNPFLKLESEKIDIIKSERIKPVIQDLIKERKIFKDDYFINRTLRRKLKMEKKEIKDKLDESLKKGLSFPLEDISKEEEMLAKKANYKLKNANFLKRDKLRLESIFSNVSDKSREISNSLLKNNANFLRSEKINLKNTPYSHNSKANCFNQSLHNNGIFQSAKSNNQSVTNDNTCERKSLLDSYTLKNNLKFNNLNVQNEMFLKKKHRMDMKLQKAFDNTIHNQKNNFASFTTNLNLLNNQIHLKIKKNIDKK